MQILTKALYVVSQRTVGASISHAITA